MSGVNALGGVFSRYVARRVISAFLIALGAVVMLIIVIDLIELLRRAGDEDVGFGALFLMAALHAPSIAIRAMPFIMLLSAMWAFMRLSRSSEFVAARAAGASHWGLNAPALAAAALCGLVAVTLLHPAAAWALDRFERMEAKYLKGGGSRLSVSDDGLWLRDGLGATQTVIHALRANNTGSMLEEVDFYEFTNDDLMLSRVLAARAVLEGDVWRLEDGVAWRFVNADEPTPPDEIRFKTREIRTELTLERIQNSFAAPEAVSFWRLPRFIANLKKSGFSARRHEVYWHSLLSMPALFAAMTLIAAAFSIRAPRFARYGRMALSCALTGFGFYFLIDVSMAMGGSGSAPPALAAWAPTVAAGMMGLALAMRFEEG